jgi:predicted DCC family thiol-disulfide oxidoreductase YuxK
LKRKQIIFLGIDQNCRFCKISGSFLKYFDFQNVLVLDSAENSKNPVLSSLPIEKKLAEMAGVLVCQNMNSSPRTFVTYGFDSLVQISRNVLVFKIFWPLLVLLKVFGIGHFFYRLIARNRKFLGCESSSSVE